MSYHPTELGNQYEQCKEVTHAPFQVFLAVKDPGFTPREWAHLTLITTIGIFDEMIKIKIFRTACFFQDDY